MILKLYGSAEAEPFQNATFSTFVFPLCSMLCVPFVQYALCSLCAVCSVFPLCSMLFVPFVQFASFSLCVVFFVVSLCCLCCCVVLFVRCLWWAGILRW